MSPRQMISELLKDYRYNLKMGMPVGQSLDVLKSQLVDLIEYEKARAYDLGIESGQEDVLHDLFLFDRDYVVKKHKLTREQ